MPISTTVTTLAGRIPPRPGTVGREFAPRQDRVPTDARVDLPEIQESWRVSFSDNARVAPGTANRQEDRPAEASVLSPGIAAALASYRRIAEL